MTASTQRTDLHRPSAIVPSDYTFIACDYLGSSEEACDAFDDERREFAEHRKQTGADFSTHGHAGTCHVCGAAALYVAHFHHKPTNTYITTGHDCANKMGIGNDRAFKNFRKAAAAARHSVAGKVKAQKTLAAAGLSAVWEIFTREDRSTFGYEETTICDIIGKLCKYGSVSEKQLAFVSKLFSKIPERAAREAARAAEKEAALPIPVEFNGKRMQVTGKVLSIKSQESHFGPVTKMLVQHADGWKLWGTVPSMITVERNDNVTFDAKVQISDNDPKFGFYSRPTKAENNTQRAEAKAEDAADRALDAAAMIQEGRQ